MQRLPQILLAVLALAPPAGALALPAAALPAQSLPRAGVAPAPRDPVEALRQDARSKAAARRFAEAIADYERLRAFAPADPDVLAHLAQLQAWSGNYEQAIVHYRAAIAAD
ncbi:MAG TPA: tetratricopeptide repeat protein, partial [Myxococcales bacterium]|nr:tetratricopeptide repeat protein [Myxococcales bacterium]